MPVENQNPITLDKRPDTPTVYNIPSVHSETMLYLTIRIKLKDKGWQFASIHNIALRGKDIFPQKLPEPTDLKLDHSKNLHQKKIFISSHVSRFRAGAESETPSIVTYSLVIEAGDILLNEFTMNSDTNNPSNFHSFIVFNLL
jgi:hypothetical protein